MSPARFWYEVRWLVWFLRSPSLAKTAYALPDEKDRRLRRLINDGLADEHDAREPQFRGTYPHRKDLAQ